MLKGITHVHCRDVVEQGPTGKLSAEGHARFGNFLLGADLFDCQVR